MTKTNMLNTCKQHDNTLPIEVLLKEFDEFVHQSTLDGISIEEVYEMIKEWITKAYHQGEAVGKKKLLHQIYSEMCRHIEILHSASDISKLQAMTKLKHHIVKLFSKANL